MASRRGNARSADGSSAPLRVLWLIKGLDRGGAEGLLALMARFSDRDAFRYEVAYLLPDRRTLVEEFQGQGIPAHCLDAGPDWHLGWAVRLRRLLATRGYDIVHVHGPYVAGIARPVVHSLPRRTRPTLIYTEHLPWSGYVLPTRALNALTFRLDDVHIAVSEAVRRSIPRWANGTVRVIRNGIDLEAVRRHLATRETVRKELGLTPGEFVVCTVANLRAQKRYVDLLRAAQMLRTNGSTVQFLAIGHGPQEAALDELHRRLRLGPTFRFLGRHEQPARVLAASDAFVLASDFEGLSLAMLEALALGLPVVGTAVDGITECVRHGREALLVPPRRPELLARAIEALVRDPSGRSVMGRAARERSRGFDIAGSVSQLEALYREAIA
jgi:glycosyltransferase involved in cell wall biosynthesis